ELCYVISFCDSHIVINLIVFTGASWSTYDLYGTTQGTQAITDCQDVVFFVGGKGYVVHAWAIATGHRGVVDGWFTTHPGGEDGAVAIRDFFGDAEAQVLHVAGGAWDIRGDLVEVIQAYQGTWYVEVVAPGEAFHMVDVVEKFVGESQWVLNANRVADTLDEAVFAAFGAAAQFFVEGFRSIDVFWRADPVGKHANRRGRALCQDEVVVDELF